MIYRFIILSDEVDNFRRDILIDSDATFFELHEAILDSVGYTKDQITSFFICDEDWTKETEIMLMEMDTNFEEDSYVMDATRLSDLLEDERQKLLYVFENLTERAFFMELKEIIPGKTQAKAECIKKTGNPPAQTTNFEDLETKVSPVSLDDDLYEEDSYNLDEYDDDDFGNLSEGDPFENY